MPMLKVPSVKYQAFPPVPLKNRQWPSKVITTAPRWLSTDLRDGNQSLSKPMNVSQKIDFFNHLVKIGYKEIEVAFPCASDIEWEFTRYLVESSDAVPDDVWLQVMSPCREELIPKTVDAIRGAKNVIIHIYVATSPEFLAKVYHMTEDETLDLAVRCAKKARSLTKDQPGDTNWRMQFSMEAFQDTRPDFAVRICEAVKAVWKPTEEEPIIFTLAATVESSTPNMFADLVEYFCTHLTEREKICVSIHPHNDRGTAIAAAEQAQLAGGDRVEGCLFGNGERTGNVDLVTLALNLYTQGISPNIDFSKLQETVELVQRINEIPVPARYPYAGQLAYCTFAGSHQDGIKKGLLQRDQRTQNGDAKLANGRNVRPWDIPYIPMDPGDVGRAHESLVRITSQSGKGGGAFILEETLSLELPRGFQIAFAQRMKARASAVGAELAEAAVVELFDEFCGHRSDCLGGGGVIAHDDSDDALMLLECNISKKRASSASGICSTTSSPTVTRQHFTAIFTSDPASSDKQKRRSVSGHGIDTTAAVVDGLKALGVHLVILDSKFHDRLGGSTKRKKQEQDQYAFLGDGTPRPRYVAFVEATTDINVNPRSRSSRWGVAMHDSGLGAVVLAILNAVGACRQLRRPTTSTKEG